MTGSRNILIAYEAIRNLTVDWAMKGHMPGSLSDEKVCELVAAAHQVDVQEVRDTVAEANILSGGG